MHIIRAGGIFLITGAGEKEFVSPFAVERLEQDRKSFANNAWKNKEQEEGAGAGLRGGMIPRSMLWNGRGSKQPVKPKAVAVARSGERLYYVLEMTKSRGLFYYDFTRDEEIRLFHKEEFDPRGLVVRPDRTLLTTAHDDDGAIHIVELDAEGRLRTQLTSGDCLDEQPCQVGRKIWYQSTGVGRRQDGMIAAHAPTVINRLDLDSGEIVTVLESPRADFLMPRVAPDGTLYCIQTPHRPHGSYAFTDYVLDVVLFPWRLACAIFGFLNVFSMFFGKRALKTGGGPLTPDVDISQRIIHNRVVNMQKTMRDEGKRVAVPKEWKLVKVATEVAPGADSLAKAETVATNVLWYDLDEHGKVVHTDGYAIYQGGEKGREFTELVTGLALAPTAAEKAKAATPA
jgi:hypothetical protein